MTREDRLRGFAPDGPGAPDRLWGLPFDEEDAALVILPVPWEVTVSYGTGTAEAPAAILQASAQVDLYDARYPGAWRKGITMAPIPKALKNLGDETRRIAAEVIAALSSESASVDANALDKVNGACGEMTAHVRRESQKLLEQGKLVGVLGGDHSVPLGLMEALAERHARFGILHIDAHCDLREAYEGFVHSHASIMHNALRIEALSKLVQVGVRDYSEQELETVRESGGRVRLFEYRNLERRRFAGESWSDVVESIIEDLPEDVYVSFDIDGLEPSLCPGTGTPVPGGLGFEEALFLVDQLSASGRKIIGFDLCEVSPGGERGTEWDANVGARVLYRLACAAISGA